MGRTQYNKNIGNLVEKNLSFPDWHERCIELEKRPVWCEGGSMEPLERNSMLYMFLDETITAMKNLQ